MQKHNKFMWMFVMVAFAIAILPMAKATTYNFTFTGASDEGFQRWSTIAADSTTATFAGDNFASATADKAASYYKNLNLTPSLHKINISFDYVTSGTSYIIVAMTELNTSSAVIYHGTGAYIEEQGSDNAAITINGSNYGLTGGAGTSGKTYNLVTYPNKTIELYKTGTKVITYTRETEWGIMPNLLIVVRRPNDKMDNIFIEIDDTPATPTLTLTTSIINNLNTTANPFLFNFTATTLNGATGMANCSFYVNDTLNQTFTNRNITLPQNFNFSTTGYDGRSFNFNVSCIQYDNATISDNLQRTNIFIDSVPPNLEMTPSFANNTIYYRKIDTINISVNYTDENLFATNLSIKRLNATGSIVQIMNNSFATSITNTSHVLNLTINPEIDTRYVNSKYMIEAQAWDSHTSYAIEDYKIEPIVEKVGVDKGIAFETDIKITSPDLVAMTPIKQFDRYSFDMEFTTSQPTIYVECKGLEYIPNSKYKGHFICWDDKKWIDFEDYSGNVEEIKVSAVSKDKMMVEINPKSFLEKLFSFNSIGDLNYRNETWYFNVTDGFTIKAKDHFSNLSIQNFSVTINTTPPQTKSTTNYNLTFNVTSGIYYTNISAPLFTPNSSNINYSTNGTFTFDMFAANSLYIFVYDEITGDLITDRNITIDVINYANQSATYTTDNGVTFQSGFSEGDYEIRYAADGYASRSYYTTIATDTTQQIELYLLNNTLTNDQYKNIKVVDDSGNGLSNATIWMMRFYIDCNCYKPVEMAKTNDAGNTFVFAQLYDATYIFRAYYGGVLRKETAQTKLDTRDVYLKVSLLSSGIQDFFDLGSGVSASLSYDNATKLYTYSWTDSGNIATSGTLKVVRSSVYTDSLIFTQTTNGTNGIIQANLSAYENDTAKFIATGYIYVNSTNITYQVAQDELDRAESYAVFGLSGVLYALILVLVLAFVGSFNPAVSIILALVALIVSTIIGLVYLSVGALIGIIIVGLIYAFGMRS